MTNESISKSQSIKLAKQAGSKTGKLKKKHIKRLKDEVRSGRIDVESNRSVNFGELMKLGAFDGN